MRFGTAAWKVQSSLIYSGFLSLLAASDKTKEQGNVLLGLGEDCKSNGKFFWNILTIVCCVSLALVSSPSARTNIQTRT